MITKTSRTLISLALVAVSLFTLAGIVHGLTANGKTVVVEGDPITLFKTYTSARTVTDAQKAQWTFANHSALRKITEDAGAPLWMGGAWPSIPGTALSAARLTTPRTINGVAFDGTANITIADSTKEVAGVAATADTAHLSAFVHGDIDHTNRAALNLVSGTNTGDQTTITGNAGTATKLQTARTINGVSFDGTANVTVSATASDVSAWAKEATKPSYTAAEVGAYSLGNTTNLQIKANIAPNFNSAVEGHVEYRTTGADYPLIGFNRPFLSSVSLYHKGYANDLLRVIDGGGNDYALIHDGNLGEKNTMSATKLQTARTINGVAFDGTANISLSAVAVDVYPWAKAATKPAYTAAEVGAPTGSGNSTGTNTGDQTEILGNAATATKLLNSRTINGVAFDGTANISLSAVAVDVYPWAKAATKPAYTAAEVGAPTGSGNSTGTNTGDQTEILGNAATATKLLNSRTINGVAFDGTADISTTAVASDVYSWAKAAAKPAYTAAEVGASPTAGPGSGQAFSTGALTASSFKTGSVNVACTANVPATLLALTDGVWQVYATAFDAANYGASATIVVAQGTAKIVANNAPLGSFSMSGLNLQYTMGATTTATFTYIKIA